MASSLRKLTLREWLSEKPFTLTMSSGFFSFFAHSGMLSVLEEENLLPRKVTGSSAGALIAAAHAAGVAMTDLAEQLFSLEQADFWDPSLGLGLLKGAKFRQMIADMTPVACLEQCRIPIAISIYDLFARRTIVVTQGPLPEMVYASAAFPFLLQPLRYNGRLYIDGGILDRPGLAGTALDERVFYHHIASKSPWRRAESPSLKIPQRPQLASLAIDELPRSGPTKLQKGPHIFEAARAATKQALNTPLTNGAVRLSALSLPLSLIQ